MPRSQVLSVNWSHLCLIFPQSSGNVPKCYQVYKDDDVFHGCRSFKAPKLGPISTALMKHLFHIRLLTCEYQHFLRNRAEPWWDFISLQRLITNHSDRSFSGLFWEVAKWSELYKWYFRFLLIMQNCSKLTLQSHIKKNEACIRWYETHIRLLYYHGWWLRC